MTTVVEREKKIEKKKKRRFFSLIEIFLVTRISNGDDQDIKRLMCRLSYL